MLSTPGAFFKKPMKLKEESWSWWWSWWIEAQVFLSVRWRWWKWQKKIDQNIMFWISSMSTIIVPLTGKQIDQSCVFIMSVWECRTSNSGILIVWDVCSRIDLMELDGNDEWKSTEIVFLNVIHVNNYGANVENQRQLAWIYIFNRGAKYEKYWMTQCLNVYLDFAGTVLSGVRPCMVTDNAKYCDIWIAERWEYGGYWNIVLFIHLILFIVFFSPEEPNVIMSSRKHQAKQLT